jgi:hypothetical protein
MMEALVKDVLSFKCENNCQHGRTSATPEKFNFAILPFKSENTMNMSRSKTRNVFSAAI